MVESEAQPEHRALGDLAAIDGWLLDNSPDAEDSGLAGIQNRRERVDSEHAEVGYRKRASGYVFEFEIAGARLFAEGAAFERDLPKRLALGAIHDRNDQPLVECDGESDVRTCGKSNLRAVSVEARIHSRMAHQGARDRMNHHIGVRKIEFAGQAGAKLSRRRHIGFGGDSDLRAGVEALMHPLGNHLAHAAKRDAIDGRRRSRWGRRRGDGRRRFRCGLGGALDIFASDPSTGAGAFEFIEIDAEFRREFAGDRAYGVSPARVGRGGLTRVDRGGLNCGRRRRHG